MSDLTVPQFTGPINAQVVLNWLRRCEHTFKRHLQNPRNHNPLTGDRKIEIVGDAIVQNESTEVLYNWWVANSMDLIESETWEGFQDALLKEALGDKWQLELLRDYYTISQRDMTAKAYTDELHNLSKCIGARPEVLEKVMENHINGHASITQAKTEDIISWLKKYSYAGTSAKSTKDKSRLPFKEAPPPIFDTFPMLYVVGQCNTIMPCDHSQKSFSDIDALPKKRFPLSKLKGITIFAYTKPTIYFAAYQLVLADSANFLFDLRCATSDNTNFERPSIQLDDDEHIAEYQIEFSEEKKNREIRDFRVKTSKGKEVGIRKVGVNPPGLTVKAPDGWAIVGFHGTHDGRDWGYPVRTIGPVFGRLSADRTEVGA
ncbi:uncharacterized protein DFL_003421 [Arthrobotrys flagrans]|uniref:Jacalin-type lectin domain-containing protein n=1 Tax=Arthrobotrys flagrans TaxID=97331 RepID=A0A437A1Y5_ARTFL|nr:hypothetical protein DFL_003421 [Arthrobotrys flagrans]